MKVWAKINQAIQYVMEAVGRVFTPVEDTYPAIGVQPFDGEIPKAHNY